MSLGSYSISSTASRRLGGRTSCAGVSTVTLELGEVSGVVHTYLEDCWHWAAARSQLLNGSRLAIEALPPLPCARTAAAPTPTVEHGKTCPFCQSPRTHLVSGNEINIKEIEAC